jgi:hypothetical protein
MNNAASEMVTRVCGQPTEYQFVRASLEKMFLHAAHIIAAGMLALLRLAPTPLLVLQNGSRYANCPDDGVVHGPE